MATAMGRATRAVESLGGLAFDFVAGLGELATFSGQTLRWVVRRRPSFGTLAASCYDVGVRSVPVVFITGLFIGMVLGVQSYSDFHRLGMESRLGSVINMSVVRELGPVLAATMIAGRVGSAMAAALGTMRVTEQIDALACLGVNPLHYLVAPRFLACVLLIPLLTVIADIAGIVGGAFISVRVYLVDAHLYWEHTRNFVSAWDVTMGLIKSVFFGGAIALISCQRGFHCRPGAEGVGRAATEAFVASFIVILALDLFLSILLNGLSELLHLSGRVTLF